MIWSCAGCGRKIRTWAHVVYIPLEGGYSWPLWLSRFSTRSQPTVASRHVWPHLYVVSFHKNVRRFFNFQLLIITTFYCHKNGWNWISELMKMNEDLRLLMWRQTIINTTELWWASIWTSWIHKISVLVKPLQTDSATDRQCHKQDCHSSRKCFNCENEIHTNKFI